SSACLPADPCGSLGNADVPGIDAAPSTGTDAPRRLEPPGGAVRREVEPRGREWRKPSPKAQPPRKRSGKRAAGGTTTLESAGVLCPATDGVSEGRSFVNLSGRSDSGGVGRESEAA